MSKILVTGSAGFIGYHLSKHLLDRGDIVVGVDNINDYYEQELKFARLSNLGISSQSSEWYKHTQSDKYPKHKFIRLNLEDHEHIDALFKIEQFDIVCNLAAQAGVRYSIENPQAYINSNVIGFFNILEASKKHGVKHLIYASSSSVYGNSQELPLKIDQNVDKPISLYAATKKSNELMAHVYSHLYNLPTTGLRFFTVYGPWGRPDMALFMFTKSILENKPIKVFNHGKMYRDFTFIDDVIAGIMGVIDSTVDVHDNVYKIFNIGNSKTLSLKLFIDEIEYNLGKKAIKQFLPIQQGDVLRTEADISELSEYTNYKPNTSVKEGVKKFTDWYKNYYNIY